MFSLFSTKRVTLLLHMFGHQFWQKTWHSLTWIWTCVSAGTHTHVCDMNDNTVDLHFVAYSFIFSNNTRVHILSKSNRITCLPVRRCPAMHKSIHVLSAWQFISMTKARGLLSNEAARVRGPDEWQRAGTKVETTVSRESHLTSRIVL